MEEIKAICKKHDIAAVAVLHTPGFGEYLVNITPSYSCARLDGNRFQVKIKASHYLDDKKLRDQFVADTTNMIHHLSTLSGKIAISLIDASKALDGAVNAEHFGGGHSPHTQQNN